ncbi:Glycosyltransferase, GT2 family [Salinimicrobium catena]|uniref:Glycosyltransferase, GT2 family n=1 Tax=Salinimicrobium catena TaxID=390640 RepID=A0A1H5LLD0_9FLAO|nr:glycosyltransferase [Salinimicrobium catena]SDL11387.1 Glycosyltransferase, GT2 family [Salinimicrobium catena]SEE77810.1 Glycosyltransferase, GT2 family [Salinimicrobium catena]
MKNSEFAAFVMTYERPETLLKTIRNLQEQTFPPAFIYIIDNSETKATRLAVEEMAGEDVGYYRVGYNSGPAGAARIGLKVLANRGYKWIYWGDDDDPPFEKWVFEEQFRVLENLEDVQKVGILGGKGGRLNRTTGRINTFSNHELEEQPILEVDSVPGGGSMLVNARVVREEILPDKKLFFGFEEFDFCLKVKKNGYRVLANAEIWLKENSKAGFNNKDFKWKASNFGKREVLWRDYYSTRNLLYIYFKNHFYKAFLFILVKSILKSFAGWRYGWNYGRKNFSLQWRGILHFLAGRFGR